MRRSREVDVETLQEEDHVWKEEEEVDQGRRNGSI